MSSAYAASAIPVPHQAFAKVNALLAEAVGEGVFPGAVLIVGRRGDVVYAQAEGHKTYAGDKTGARSPMSLDTVFDVAALTNIVVTSTLAMNLVESAKLKLDDRVVRYLQGFGVHGKSAITIAQLLNHSSGLIHWVPYFEELLRANAGARLGILTSRGAREYIYNSINRSQLKYEPGTKQVYSDVGFILLGHVIEVLTGLSLDKAAQRFVFQPLGLKSTSYVDLSMIKRRGIHPITDVIAPTEECPWRKRVLCGEVHDDNAWAMGGIAGHSGLFTTALDLHSFARTMLAAYHGESPFLRREVVSRFWSRPQIPGELGWSHGWELPSEENGMIETSLSREAVGHCGFTGCSLWIEPHHGIDIVFMSNRVHPSRTNKKIFSFRTDLHKAVLEALSHL